MPRSAWSGKYPSGEKFTLYIHAPNVESARASLQERGCTELQLHEDDLGSAVHDLFGQDNEVSATEMLHFREKGRSTVGDIIWTNLKTYPFAYTFLAILFVLNLVGGRINVAVLFGVAFICLFLFRLWFSLPRLFFAWMMEAREWHRWDEVLNWCQRLGRMYSCGPKALPAYALSNYRSQALAGRGNLAAALQEFQRFENDSQVPKWLYLSQLAGIYDVVRDHDKAIDLARQAAELNPSYGLLHLGLAERLILRRRDPVSARAALSKVEALPVVDMALPFVLHSKGLIHLEEGDCAEAKRLLTEALQQLQKLSRQPLIGGIMRQAKASLSMACAKCGDAEQARQLLAEVRGYLLAIREEEYLHRCEQCIQVAGKGVEPFSK